MHKNYNLIDILIVIMFILIIGNWLNDKIHIIKFGREDNKINIKLYNCFDNECKIKVIKE